MDFPIRKIRFCILSAICLMAFVSTAPAQYKIDLQTCEELKIAKKQHGAEIVETATCVNPTKNFKPKGTLRNVFVLATFPAVPTGAGITFMITKNDADGEYVQNMDYSATRFHTTAYMPFTINTPGKYFVRMVNFFNKSQVWATTDFNVGEDTVGARAVGNTAAGQGKVSICKEIDDAWKCVGQSNEWKANQPFNVLFENPTPSGVDFIGIVFHKQDATGRDVAFVNEYQQNIGMENRKYATVGDSFRLPAGVYSVYIIGWGKRELMVHNGNLTDYFAKMTLTVK
ncbi:MAG TPA: hypothetical protein VNO50_02445 [Pyrinomonadaceae bacterium]|nr:hypothetical protein [Pyrinomonadaceae bacterium]